MGDLNGGGVVLVSLYRAMVIVIALKVYGEDMFMLRVRVWV